MDEQQESVEIEFPTTTIPDQSTDEQPKPNVFSQIKNLIVAEWKLIRKIMRVAAPLPLCEREHKILVFGVLLMAAAIAIAVGYGKFGLLWLPVLIIAFYYISKYQTRRLIYQNRIHSVPVICSVVQIENKVVRGYTAETNLVFHTVPGDDTEAAVYRMTYPAKLTPNRIAQGGAYIIYFDVQKPDILLAFEHIANT